MVFFKERKSTVRYFVIINKSDSKVAMKGHKTQKSQHDAEEKYEQSQRTDTTQL